MQLYAGETLVVSRLYSNYMQVAVYFYAGSNVVWKYFSDCLQGTIMIFVFK